jgi:hypothetical protein
MGAIVGLVGAVTMGAVGGSKEAIIGLAGAVGSRARTNTPWAWSAAYAWLNGSRRQLKLMGALGSMGAVVSLS